MTVKVHMGDGSFAELEPEKYEVDAALLEPVTTWKPEVLVEGKWAGNGLVFATEDEAARWARALLGRWFVPTDSRAASSTEPVNARLLEDGTCEHIREGA